VNQKLKNQIFIGWDSRDQDAYKVCEYSIKRRLSIDIPIFPLKQSELRERNIYQRPIDVLASTEFSLTRFLVPHLSDYKDFSIFLDCDFLVLEDIYQLLESIDKSKAISVVKHEYTPSNSKKMDGKSQHLYPRKNWSSFIVFNNQHPSNLKLTPEIVNSESPQFLHRFSWLDDNEIGEISHEWNYLVGWYSDIERPKAIHYTEGGPWFDEYINCDFSKDWLHEYYLMSK
jgi:lipopolysaccharide biosynthesis glycosyltransferase